MFRGGYVTQLVLLYGVIFRIVVGPFLNISFLLSTWYFVWWTNFHVVDMENGYIGGMCGGAISN